MHIQYVVVKLKARSSSLRANEVKRKLYSSLKLLKPDDQILIIYTNNQIWESENFVSNSKFLISSNIKSLSAKVSIMISRKVGGTYMLMSCSLSHNFIRSTERIPKLWLSNLDESPAELIPPEIIFLF